MNIQNPTKIVILGGGTSGWMSATALAVMLGAQVDVTLVESEDIGIIGVGEATLPHLRHFVETLGIDEADFMRATHATYKLGIDFRDFGKIGDSYIHPFGSFGDALAGVPFHHYWLAAQKNIGDVGSIGDYSMGVAAALANKFAPPASDNSLASTYGYAYQFDATLFGPFMRDFATAKGVKRVEGRVNNVQTNPENGNVETLILESGNQISGDIFIDCSGFRSMLLGQTLGAEWEDWSHWLPCDRAVAVPCTAENENEIEPYTRAIAMPAGWRWRIPLQHRIGNGYVYASQYLSDDEAKNALINAIEGKPLAEPKLLKFKAGRRKKSFIKNVIGVGLSSGFLEPLESTSIYLAQMAITNFIELFPKNGVIQQFDRDAFNQLVDMEYDRIRDFLILHYHATTRDDTPFWDHVRTMEIPHSLSEKMELWRQSGHVSKYSQGLFYEPSWVAVYLGQNIYPTGFDPRTEIGNQDGLFRALHSLKNAISKQVNNMPSHRAYLHNHAKRLADIE
ncbi:tryptophan halogenase [Sphingorhabdus lutea]|uniref:Tryptophan halogenase n=1 Tax=Sphingorhabdus lutea TaxID=1913578 RepID=A0A1L3JB80_9SPHN|nr:tryptophan halogenase family protein [Sphingorhabdus lutea]APG62323.1 tryptophan halogenase [Sphingorhabdus lutea]